MPDDNMRQEQQAISPVDIADNNQQVPTPGAESTLGAHDGNIGAQSQTSESPSPYSFSALIGLLRNRRTGLSEVEMAELHTAANGSNQQSPEQLAQSSFDQHMVIIGMLQRDFELTEDQVHEYERSVPRPENVKRGSREKAIEDLIKERQRLAIANFPKYTSGLRDFDPESEDAVISFEERFRAAEGNGPLQAEISEEIREKLNSIILEKVPYYVDMFQNLLIESGSKSSSEAQIAALSELEEIETATSLPEKAKAAKELEGKTTILLISSLDRTIEVWNALYPGEGDVEEIRLNSSNGEGERIKLAQELYKKTKEELDKRRGRYGERLLAAYNDSRNEHPNPFIGASENERRLSLLPRLEQIKAMETDPGL